MPIRADLRQHYGAAWRETRAAVLERAGHRCEQCGKPDRARVLVTRDGTGRWCSFPLGNRWRDRNGDDAPPPLFDMPPTPTYLIRRALTVAHLNHVAGDDRMENLKALCEACHLRYDRRLHFANARRTRAKAIKQGWLTAELEATA